MDFAENLKRCRMEKGYNQQYVADCLALDRSAIAHYEKGDVKPNLENFVKLCKLYGVTPNDMLNYIG